MDPKYPDIIVELGGTGQDGNAFAILARVHRAMRSAGLSKETIAAFTEEAQSGDYDNLLQTVMRWVSTS